MPEKKLRPKYTVQRVDEIDSPGGPLLPRGEPMVATDPDDVDSPFVLMPRKDPAAFYALLHYAQVCEDDLAREIRVWLEKVVKAPAAHGTQGERNRVAMKLKQMDLIQ